MAFLILILFQGSSLPQAHKSEIFQTYAEERLLGSTPTSTIQEDLNRYGAVIRPFEFWSKDLVDICLSLWIPASPGCALWGKQGSQVDIDVESLCSLVVMDEEKYFVKDLFDTVSTELCLIFVATDDHASIAKPVKKLFYQMMYSGLKMKKKKEN